jgi:hypothetical protein
MKKTPEQILEDAAQECESANAHDRCSLPDKLYAEIQPMVKPKDRVKLAKAIAEAVTSGI